MLGDSLERFELVSPELSLRAEIGSLVGLFIVIEMKIDPSSMNENFQRNREKGIV